MLISNFVIVTEHLLLKWDIVKLFLSAGKEMYFSHLAQGVDHCVGNVLFMNWVTNRQHAGKCY